MENKKGPPQSQNNSNVAPTIDVSSNEAIPKHAHQHNNAPQHLRFLQYGLKIPNHQHPQLTQTHAHQQLNPPLHMHLHQQYQTTHRHLQPSPQFNSINIHQNPNFPSQNHKYAHQHQKPNMVPNQPLYQTTQPPPSSVHAHNQMAKNTPQIWVPHQPPPIHYHQQQQQQAQKAEAQKPSTPTTPQSQTKPKELERKKSSGGSSHLRSPSAKRPLEAPVTMQGWLHKQGSEGLMLWKKRWFVLSEYCLFYYKGLEEEKLLGSILLPSYKVSICRPEDKVNKKYAFKCEHANMRTYILAADSQELMMQWVRVLNLACMLQTNTETEKPAVDSTTPPKPVENSDANLHQKHNRSTPIHTHSSSNTTDLSNPSQQDRSQYNQPLYANAPPKPRRLNDGFSSPSPDVLDRYPNTQYIEPVHAGRAMAKSPVSVYSQMQQPEYYQHTRPKDNSREYMFTPTGELHNPVQNTERRTPDTYGRSKLHPNKFRHPTDYEDVYNDQSMYKRPLSPIAYTHVVKKNTPPLNPAYRAYTPVNMLGPTDIVQYVPPQMRKSSSYIARPHSADFLEYEINHRQPNSAALSRQQPRPKSSLDINRNPNDSDNYFYSEERYAEKMRKSAQYLHKMPPRIANPQEVQTRNMPPARYPESDKTFPLMRSSTQPVNFNTLRISEAPPDPQPLRSRSVLSEGSLSKEIDMDFCGSSRNITERESVSSGYSARDIYNYSNNNNNIKNQYDQFTRSASARLAQNVPQNERPQDKRQMTREGERKREESMRRLLEWKQRMLQSPLNRKTQGNRVYQGRCDNYHMNPENGYVIHNHPKHGEPHLDDRRSIPNLPQYNSYSSDDEASGSISINTRDMSQLNARDTFPRAISAKKIWALSPQPLETRSVTNLSHAHEMDEFRMPNQQGYYVSQHDMPPEVSHQINTRKENWPVNDKMNVSAGELLGRTHEELVLLLIQLRRQSAQTLQAIENCYNEIDTIQAQLHMMDQARRMENLQRLEQIKQHLLELEKQYEKGKPLVNLVDNMVKLGSLYRVPSERPNLTPYIRDRLEFNQQIQERRLLAEEKREWSRLNPNHFHLQEKVQQLYQLDRLIHEESGTLQNLQQDKEDIERALGGLRHRLSKGFNDPAEIEQARKQQIVLENELSRVHLMLAQNSKKLEETVAGNARLEQELLVLKQKLQTSRQQRGSQQFSNAGDSLTCAVGNSAMLESDLQRVQKKIGDLQKQRQELSIQVRQLTDRSNTLPQQKSPSSIQNSQCNKKKIPSLWRETDLDTMNIVDHGDSWDNSNSTNASTPLYINTDIKQLGDSDFYNRSVRSSDSTSDNTSLNSNLPQEKQEIKTVRIVKRESERRQRDREKTTTGKWDALMEEDDSSQNSSILFRPTPVQKIASATNLISPSYEEAQNDMLNRQSSVSSPNLPHCSDGRTTSSTDVSTDKSPELSPIFKSEAARQIITEMSIHDTPKQTNRRAVPKEKRRHYTAPHNNLIMKSLHQLPTDNNAFNKMILNNRRARDDLDMERALRQRIDAPDVVRSTLSNKELKYNESTIDNILGTPNKISIPERYIPEQLPQLSAEEQEYRLRKVESIKKMLSDTTLISSSSSNLPSAEDKESESTSSSITSKATSKMIEEKKQREHLLHLNQILAKQVMEMSKIVAVKALAKLPLQLHQMSTEEEDSSPLTPLPLYQQRDNFYS